jgi:hypothetical protein
MRRFTLPAALAAALALPVLASGEDAQEEYRKFGPTELTAQIALGSKVVVTGKYKELVDQELLLFDCAVPFLLKRKDLFRKVLEFRSHRDNLTLTGQAIEGEVGTAIEVDSLEAAPSDLEVFTEEASAITTTGADKGRALCKLAKRVLTAHERYRDPDLLPLGKQFFTEGIDLLETKLEVAALDAHLAVIKEFHAILRDRALAIEVLGRLNVKFSKNEKVERFLRDLNCRPYRGQWVTYEQFKEFEGLVLHEGKWVQPREKHMTEALEIYRKIYEPDAVIRKRTDREYERLAEKGSVDIGMKPEEVCGALGFPDRVERRSLEQKEFDQWSYGDKYYYFHGGVLVLKHEG